MPGHMKSIFPGTLQTGPGHHCSPAPTGPASQLLLLAPALSLCKLLKPVALDTVPVNVMAVVDLLRTAATPVDFQWFGKKIKARTENHKSTGKFSGAVKGRSVKENWFMETSWEPRITRFLRAVVLCSLVLLLSDPRGMEDFWDTLPPAGDRFFLYDSDLVHYALCCVMVGSSFMKRLDYGFV